MNMSSRLWWWGQMLMVVLMARQNGIYVEKVLPSVLTHRRGMEAGFWWDFNVSYLHSILVHSEIDLGYKPITFMNNKQIMLFQPLYIMSCSCSENFWQLLTTQKVSIQNQTQSSHVTMTNSESQIIFTSCRNKTCHSAQKSVMTIFSLRSLSLSSYRNCFYQISATNPAGSQPNEWTRGVSC